MRRRLLLPALLFVAVALPVAVYGLWLVATPDADGGRRPFGLMVSGIAVAVVLIGARLAWASSPRRA